MARGNAIGAEGIGTMREFGGHSTAGEIDRVANPTSGGDEGRGRERKIPGELQHVVSGY